MKKMISIAILAVSVALTGCSTIAPKAHEGKGYSKAKEIMVGLGVPQQYITDGDTPQTAKFEGQTWTDGVTKHAGLATAVATLSITNTFMATMGSSDYEKQVAWKKALTRPIIFVKSEESYSDSEATKIYFHDYFINNGYLPNDKGFYVKDDEKLLGGGTLSDAFIENGKKYYYINLTYGNWNTKTYDPKYLNDFYNKTSKDKNLYKYSPAKDGEPAYVEHNGVKHYFVKGQ
jgi:outer membrane protein assembly factor BamE (lipoprotein component of BamABCDE complex)